MDISESALRRTQLLLGRDTMTRLAESRVIIFGVGGVGSWCAESLARSGVGHLTIVDSDRVCITNMNRQLMATTKTVGQVKVDALADRLRQVAPACHVEAIQAIYSADNADTFKLDSYDYVVDAIDSLKDKADLICRTTEMGVKLYSSMGAALKMDPTKIDVAEFWDVKGCPLARALRQRFKRDKRRPARKFLCVYSPELLSNNGTETTCGTDKCVCPRSENGPGDPALLNHEWCSKKAQINGTLAHITAIFGFTIAGLIIKDICG